VGREFGVTEGIGLQGDWIDGGSLGTHADSSPVQDFRRLLVWQKAHALALAIRSATYRLRRSEFASLRLQAIRSAESIPANIVEGCYADSRKEFARFLGISIRSCGELEYHLQLAHDYGVVPRAAWESLTAKTTEVRRMLVVFRRRVLQPPLLPL
jgi:four helix bundle protein